MTKSRRGLLVFMSSRVVFTRDDKCVLKQNLMIQRVRYHLTGLLPSVTRSKGARYI
jgi:hypothetical protein